MIGSKGAVACGHPATAAAAIEILEDGGNAFDAALAALCAATVAEPVLSSLAGGGFLMACPIDQEARLYDFFVQTPRERPGQGRNLSEIDFYPIHADFGTATQEFHIGLGAMATPGMIKGLFQVHDDLARLPMRRLVEPAVALARDGVELRPVDSYLFEVVGPILTAREDSRHIYTKPDGVLLRAGDRTHQPDLADTLELLAREGEGLFYEGEMSARLAEACRDQGGLVTREDLAGYQVALRRPLERRYHGARILSNPPPSTGGILIAFALALLSELDSATPPFGTADHLARLIWLMASTNRARVESRLHETVSQPGSVAEESLLDPQLLADYAKNVKGHRPSPRGTTHVSVIDAAGNIASLSMSNGEGCGYVLPGTGIMLNNMLGEEDLNPEGFHHWPANSRLSSMMAPTVAFMADGSTAALGSGGSNRIRTAILQVLMNLIDFGMPASQAVDAPRVHFERGVANIEAGFEENSRAALSREAIEELVSEVKDWPRHNLFFGGVHVVTRGADRDFAAAGDPRRGGAALIA